MHFHIRAQRVKLHMTRGPFLETPVKFFFQIRLNFYRLVFYIKIMKILKCSFPNQ